ncbi:MAG: hemerythrin domain-containing protein [Pseudobdellovibrionaceae bacterium]
MNRPKSNQKSHKKMSQMITKSKAKLRAKTASRAAAKIYTSPDDKIGEEDIVHLLLQDHKPMKKLLKILKNTENSIEDRQAAFEEFAPLFISHIKPEEQTFYVYLKHDDKAREQGLVGGIEHALANHLVEEAKRTVDDTLWSARVKVMSELVEKHLTEEDEILLPKFKKITDVEERRELGRDFLKLKNRLLEQREREVSEENLESPVNH